MNKQIKELNDKKVKTEASLKDVTEKNIKLKKEYNQLRKQRGIKVVYLTFDDGPTPNNTPKILDILKKNNIKIDIAYSSNLGFLLSSSLSNGGKTS